MHKYVAHLVVAILIISVAVAIEEEQTQQDDPYAVENLLIELTSKVDSIRLEVDSMKESLERIDAKLAAVEVEQPAPSSPLGPLIIVSVIIIAVVGISFFFFSSHIKKHIHKHSSRVQSIKSTVNEWKTKGYSPFHIKKTLYKRGFSQKEIELAFEP